MKTSLYFFIDCHFESDFSVKQEQIDSLSTIISQDKNDNIILAFSGDLSQSGHAEEYESFETFLSLLRDEVLNKKISFVCCPGNHDILLEPGEKYTASDIDNDVKNKRYDDRLNKLSEYYAFQRKHTKLEKISTYVSRTSISLFDESIIIYSLNNVAFTCCGEGISSDSTMGHAFIGHDDIESIIKNDGSEKVVLLMHYPEFFFEESIRKQFKKQISQNVDILLYGHFHLQETSVMTDDMTVNCILGDAFHNNYNNESGFVKIDLDENEYDTYRWDVEENIYVPKNNIKSLQFSSYLKNKNGIVFDNDFYNGIIHIKCLNNTYNLNDIYVFPALSPKKYLGTNKREGNIVDFDHFVKTVSSSERIVIYGCDKSGKSSLANYLTVAYFNKGFIPILCKGQDLENCDYKLSSIISHNVSLMYKNKDITIELIKQKYKRDKKVLIIDDYTYGDLQKLSDFFEYFGNVIIISNSDNLLMDNSILSFNGKAMPIFYIEQLYKEKRKQLYRKLASVIDARNKTPKMSIEIFCDKMERFIKNLYLSDSFDPQSVIALAEKIYETGDSLDNEYYSTVYQAKALINLNDVIVNGQYNISVTVFNRLTGFLANLMYKGNKSTFTNEDIKMVFKEEDDNYGKVGISIQEYLCIGKKTLIFRENKSAELTFYNRDIFSYYVAYFINENQDVSYVEQVFKNDITVPVNFAIAMCLSSINNIKEIPNLIVEKIFYLSKNENKLSSKNFSLSGLSDEKIKQLKKMTKEEIDQITHEESEREQERRENYLQNKENLYYTDIFPDEIKDLFKWHNFLKICCILLSRFSDILKKPIKEKLIEMVLEIPNIILSKFNEYFFTKLDSLYIAFKDSVQGKTNSELIDALNSFIIDVKRGFILSTYDMGSRCFANPSTIEMLSDRVPTDVEDDLKCIQGLMLKSFISGSESAFINACLLIINDKKLEDYSFRKVAAKLIGRQFYTRNNVYCDTKARDFVKSIFKSYSDAHSHIEREKKRR